MKKTYVFFIEFGINFYMLLTGFTSHFIEFSRNLCIDSQTFGNRLIPEGCPRLVPIIHGHVFTGSSVICGFHNSQDSVGEAWRKWVNTVARWFRLTRSRLIITHSAPQTDQLVFHHATHQSNYSFSAVSQLRYTLKVCNTAGLVCMSWGRADTARTMVSRTHSMSELLRGVDEIVLDADGKLPDDLEALEDCCSPGMQLNCEW